MADTPISSRSRKGSNTSEAAVGESSRTSNYAVRRRSDEEKNTAPSQWGRRLARAVGDKFGVKMSSNQAKNEGAYLRKDIVIKCAKSTAPPIFVLSDMLERIDEVWGVFLMDDDSAQVWSISAGQVRDSAYFTHGPNVQKRAEIYLRQIIPIGKLIGVLTPDEVAACRIP